MINKTELLPCPFCGTDEDIDPDGVLNSDGTRSPECMGCGATTPTVETWNCRISAPAEDVRAVVEGPVDALLLEDCVEMASREYGGGYFGTEVVQLYRRPQRPVVLSERKEIIMGRPNNQEDSSWNACLDEFERLNK